MTTQRTCIHCGESIKAHKKRDWVHTATNKAGCAGNSANDMRWAEPVASLNESARLRQIDLAGLVDAVREQAAEASSPDEQNINNAGGIPATSANPYFNATLFLEASRKAGKSTPVDNTVHNHSVIGVQERELASIAYCECGIAFADVTVSDAINTLLDHINNPAADEAKIEAHRARVAYSTRGDFTMDELFPPDQTTLVCRECGANVTAGHARSIHLGWHNKLLP